MSNVYDNSSIDLQIGANRIRLRPASMLGSSGLAGARHGFTEIYGNALDDTFEKRESHATPIILADNIRQTARGIIA